ncbi:hypothetical protein TNCV_3543731 [Trichonephila clavipes]|nr:hypothetical protein TNCV_3543731 [Trichonephila clavipes]
MGKSWTQSGQESEFAVPTLFWLIFNHHLTTRNSFAPGHLEVKLNLHFKGSTLRLRKRFQEVFFKHHLFAKVS